MSEAALEALAAVIERGGDVDDVLRTAVDLLAAEPGIGWAGIRFLDEGQLVPGPSSGDPDDGRRIATPILYQGEAVGELLVDGDIAREALQRFAELIAPHVLLGWDTGGEAWNP